MGIMKCPRCGGQFKNESHEGFPIRRCAACSGIWLDANELGMILQKAHHEFSPQFVRSTLSNAKAGIPKEEFGHPRMCPACTHAMKPVNFSYSSGIIMDVCSEHGIWFDKDELERVEAFHESWEEKKDDIKREYQATFKKIEQDYWNSYEKWRKEKRDSLYWHFLLFHFTDQLETGWEKSRRE